MNVYLMRLTAATAVGAKGLQCLHSAHAVQTVCEHWAEVAQGAPSLSTLVALYVVAETSVKVVQWLYRRWTAQRDDGAPRPDNEVEAA